MAAPNTAGLKDVELYLSQIQQIIKQYRRVVERLEGIRNDKRKVTEKMELITERHGLKESFIQKKQACRANCHLLPEALCILKERALKDLQDEYREIDSQFKALGVLVEQQALLGQGGEEKFDPARATNDALLDKASDIQARTTANLRDALSQVSTATETGRYAAAQLEADREKIARINKGLDEVESELEISKKLLTRFIKRIYTDKVVIAFAFLLVCGIAGIIVYATLNPNQKIFNVPDAAKPPTPPSGSIPSV